MEAKKRKAVRRKIRKRVKSRTAADLWCFATQKNAATAQVAAVAVAVDPGHRAQYPNDGNVSLIVL